MDTNLLERIPFRLLAYSLGVFVASSLGLFIVFGLRESFIAGYIHAVVFYYFKKRRIQ
jgi:hypothetical protein